MWKGELRSAFKQIWYLVLIALSCGQNKKFWTELMTATFLQIFQSLW